MRQEEINPNRKKRFQIAKFLSVLAPGDQSLTQPRVRMWNLE